MTSTVVVTRKIFEQSLARLAPKFRVIANQDDVSLDATELHARVKDADAILSTTTDRIDAALLDAAPKLRAVCNIAVGYNNIDVAACTQRGIVVTNTPDVLTETTADLGFALLLATARRITESEAWLRAGQWKRWELDQMLGLDVHGTTLGILGMGRIGGAIARRASGFDMRVIYHNRSRSDQECGAHWVDKTTLLRESDHLVLVLPYSQQTHHIIGAAELSLMKPTATLINIARGGIVDDAALVHALKNKQIAAAGLDVFENEPALHPGLLECQNVVLTPHIGSASRATRMAMANLAIDNLRAVLDGQRPTTPVNPEVLGKP
ncbi:MAG TPA: D-glycerate dehydrogenase [Burkholderiaceae bacterium]|nr:D-glycerate dehydrogenase [Burkholderiaceae bacterium]